ncbi:hypothetical protein T492DRAFT_1123591 [Pavlovales sp. CCMP2436]|nr:hypothetical protein T492DRAFT_1123591 [Pavlovales sp. CCMP2436]
MSSEALPDYFNYVPRPVAPPAEMLRHYLTSTGGGAPQTGGAKAEFSIPCSNPGLHLDPSQTVLSFQINNNNNTGPMTLDGGAHAIIQSINVFFGSVHISSIDEYGALFALTQDFTTDLDSLRSSGTVRGVADFLPGGVATLANIKDVYYSRNGATIAASGSLMVALPLMSVLGTLAMKALPLSQLQDSIKLEIKWATQTNWGTFADAASAISGCTVSDIKLHISQVRLDGAVERAMMDSLGGIVHCPTLDYSHFRSTVAPNTGFINMQIPIHTAINCTGSAAEARFELARTFGSGVSDASARSCISAEQFLTDGRFRRLMLSLTVSLPATCVVFESKISASNPACYLDVWVQHEKLIVCQNGLMTYEEA